MQTLGLPGHVTRDAVHRWRGAPAPGVERRRCRRRGRRLARDAVPLGRGRRTGIAPSPARAALPMDTRPGCGGPTDARGLPDVGQGQDRRPAPTRRARGQREHHRTHPQDADGAGCDHAGPDPAPQRAARRPAPQASRQAPAQGPQAPVRSSNSIPSPSRPTPAGPPSNSSPPMTPSQSGPAPRPGDAPPHTTPSASSTGSRPTCPSPAKPSRSMATPNSTPSDCTRPLAEIPPVEYLAKHPAEETFPAHMS